MKRLPCKYLLQERLPDVSPECSFCGERESIDHIFFNCPHAINVWIHSPLRLRSFLLMDSNMIDKWLEFSDF